MARARNIKPGFFKNEDLAECSVWARYIFPGLWMLADREGRMEDRPKRIKGELLPFDSEDVEALLHELESRGFIIRYQNSDGRFIQISKFSQHQAPHYSEKASVIKPPILQESSIDHEPRKPEASGKYPPIKRGAQPPDSLIPDSLIPDSLSTTASAEAEPDFDEAWSSYPKRAGGNPKNRALKAWRARLKEGVAAKEITDGVIRYAAFIRATGREHTEFVMQAATFYGPDRQFAEPWNPPQESRKPVEWWSSDAAAEAKGLELGISPRAGEGWPQFKDRIRAKLNERIAA